MLLSSERICALYESAENPQGEILRLAQLCRVRPSEIAAVLAENARELPPGMSADEPVVLSPVAVPSAPITPVDDAQDGARQASVWTKERVEQLLALKAEGLHVGQIAEKMELGARQVGNKLQRLKEKGAMWMGRPVVGAYTKACADSVEEVMAQEGAACTAVQVAKKPSCETPREDTVLSKSVPERMATPKAATPPEACPPLPDAGASCARREGMLAHMEELEGFALRQLGAVKIIALSGNAEAATASVLFECAGERRYRLQMAYLWPQEADFPPRGA